MEVLDFSEDCSRLIDSYILSIHFDLYSNSIIFKIIQFKLENLNGENKCIENYYYEVNFKRVRRFRTEYKVGYHCSGSIIDYSLLDLVDIGIEKTKDNLFSISLDLEMREMIIECEDIEFMLRDNGIMIENIQSM